MGESKNKMKLRKNKFLEAWGATNARITGVFVILVLAIFPLVIHDRYADILRFKYWTYIAFCIGLLLALGITAVIYIYKDAKYYRWSNLKQMWESFSWRKIGAPCITMMVFVVVSVISTFQSEYFYESFWGNEGRYNGLFLTLFYGSCFVITSKCLRYKRVYLDLFLAGGIVVSTIGILHYFRIDPLGFKEGLASQTYNMFFSTIGNANTYTAYLALLAAVSTLLFLIEEKKNKRGYYLFAVVVTYMALITGLSDNAYLSLGVLFGFLPLYLFKNMKGIKQYLFLITILATEIWIVGEVERRFPGHVLELGSIFNVIARSHFLIWIVIVLWFVVLCIHFLRKTTMEGGGNTTALVIRKAWAVILALAFVVICLILIDANLLGNGERYGAIQNYVVFNDAWGTLRGFAWRMAVESFQRFPFLHKIFGFGPDTFGILTTQSYSEEMHATYQIFENAHNEYLQYLVTVGIAGLLAYLSVLITSVRQMLHQESKRPELMAIIFAIGCYAVQAVVNLNVLIVVLVMLTLLAVGTAGARERDEWNQSD